MEFQLPRFAEDSFNIVKTRIVETAEQAFETLVWSESIPELYAILDDSVANAVFLAVADFLGNPAVSEIVNMHDMTPEFIGRNLVLSGNRHGTGFWDSEGQTEATKEQLQTLHNYSIPIEVYEGDDEVWYAY